MGDAAIRYRCNGRLLALKTKAAQTFHIPPNVATDIYTFYAITNLGYTVDFCRNAVTYYLLANNWRDYIYQQIRYKRDNVKFYFPHVYHNFQTITFAKQVTFCIKSMVTRAHPIHLIIILITIYGFITVSAFIKQRKAQWTISPSTKRVIATQYS